MKKVQVLKEDVQQAFIGTKRNRLRLLFECYKEVLVESGIPLELVAQKISLDLNYPISERVVRNTRYRFNGKGKRAPKTLTEASLTDSDKTKTPQANDLETDRIEDALEKGKPTQEPCELFQLLREQEDKRDFTVPYQVARNIAVPHQDPYELYPVQLSEVIHQILAVEAPIHFDELVTRMREQWGWSRAADRFRNHVSEGLKVLISKDTVALEANFINLPAKGEVKVRKRDQDAPVGTRKSIHIPPLEIDLALELVTKAAHRLSREEAAKEVSTALGYKSLSSDFKGLIDSRIKVLLQRGTLSEAEGKLTLRNGVSPFARA